MLKDKSAVNRSFKYCWVLLTTFWLSCKMNATRYSLLTHKTTKPPTVVKSFKSPDATAGLRGTTKQITKNMIRTLTPCTRIKTSTLTSSRWVSRPKRICRRKRLSWCANSFLTTNKTDLKRGNWLKTALKASVSRYSELLRCRTKRELEIIRGARWRSLRWSQTMRHKAGSPSSRRKIKRESRSLFKHKQRKVICKNSKSPKQITHKNKKQKLKM